MSNTIIIKNREPQAISIRGGGEVLGITTVYVNGIDVTEGSVAYVVVPTKTSELINDSGFLTHEVDPTVPYYVKQITQADINAWNNKQEELVSGTNIKTVNSQSLLGSGNIDISTSYTAGTGININEENVISNTITSYNDLTDLPTIPTATSELLNDSGYLVADDLSNVAFSGSYADLSDVPDLSEYATLDTEDLENYYTKSFMWNMLPKSSGSGVIINLSDTLKQAPIEISLAPSELSQEATPTPSSPQDIHTISGDNKVVVSKKNLFDGSRSVNSTFTASVSTALEHFKATGEYATGYCDNTNKINAYASTYETCFVQVAPNTTYRLSSQGAENNGFSCIICLDNNGNSLLASGNWQGANYTINTPAGTKYLMFSPRILNVMYVQLEYGETTTTYEPYTSQEAYIDLDTIEYCKIGNYEDKFIRNSGKNLFDMSTSTTKKYINYTNGVVSNSNDWSVSDYIEIKPNTNYVVSGITNSGTAAGNSFYDSSKNFISSVYTTEYSFTTPNNAKYVRLSVKSETPTSVMFNEGTTALPYEPYGSNEWYIKKNIPKKVLDGSETITIQNAKTNSTYFQVGSVIGKTTPATSIPSAYSNYFTANTGNELSSTDTQGFTFSANGYLRINVLNSIASTVENFKTWLSSNNPEFIYQSDTPTYTKITGTLETQLENVYYNLTAYDNQTNISQTNDDLPFVISATTLKTLANL